MKIRILHIIGALNRGGIETWLSHIVKYINKKIFKLDFIVHSPTPGEYDNEIKRANCNIIYCPTPSNPLRYYINLSKIINKYGPYLIFHSHVHHYSGFTSLIAKRNNIPIRIVHSHNDTSKIDQNSPFFRKIYLLSMKKAINLFSNKGLAASRIAGDSLFPKGWKLNKEWEILYYGIDLNKFYEVKNININELKKEFNIPKNSLIIGHIGRFYPQKNHEFILKIFQELIKIKENSYLLLVGDGPLKNLIQKKATELNLNKNIIFTGIRRDIPRILRLLDVFILPSFYEGLPVVSIEAQASGIPIILSNTITNEANIIPSLITRLDINNPQKWAYSIIKNKDKKLPIETSLNILEKSPFNIRNSVSKLEKIYINLFEFYNKNNKK